MNRRQTIALLVAAGVASAAGGLAFQLWPRDGKRADSRPPAIADRIFATKLADLEGTLQPLEQWRGQVLVINFWATWCAPCREEIPGFVRLQERHGPRGLRLVGIAVDQPAKVAAFAREFRINYPLLIAQADVLELLRQSGNQAGVLPYTLVIDRHGRVISREPGGLKENKLETLVSPLL